MIIRLKTPQKQHFITKIASKMDSFDRPYLVASHLPHAPPVCCLPVAGPCLWEFQLSKKILEFKCKIELCPTLRLGRNLVRNQRARRIARTLLETGEINLRIFRVFSPLTSHMIDYSKTFYNTYY